jgi:hypothetical protein
VEMALQKRRAELSVTLNEFFLREIWPDVRATKLVTAARRLIYRNTALQASLFLFIRDVLGVDVSFQILRKERLY